MRNSPSPARADLGGLGVGGRQVHTERCVVVLSVELIPYSLHPTLPHPTLSQAKKVISGITVFDMAAPLITKTRRFDEAEGLQLSPDDPTSPALI